MLVVSHDRRFLETICERLWVVDGGLVAPFDGGYRAWREAVGAGWTVASALEQEARRLQPRSGTPMPASPVAVGAGSTAGRAGSRRSGRATRSVAAEPVAVVVAPIWRPRLSKEAYRRQRETVDGELTRLGLRKNHLELEMGKPSIQANFIELRRITSELADVEAALAATEDAWLSLEERAP
jgi:hypothetical protein